jgi:hypothetical protein
MNQIIPEDNPPVYRLRLSRRARRLRISIAAGGEVTVTRPWFVSERTARAFISQQAAWIKKHLVRLNDINVNSLRPGGTKADYQARKGEALAIVTERLAYFNQTYGFVWTRITIKNQKTRWGSCSRRGHLNFNYCLAALAPELRDYIIVHELCHLREFNHSPRFWNLVARVLPDYKERRRRLRGRTD